MRTGPNPAVVMVSALVKVGKVVDAEAVPYLSAAVCTELEAESSAATSVGEAAVMLGSVVVESLAVLLKEHPEVTRATTHKRPRIFVVLIDLCVIFASSPREVALRAISRRT